MRARPLQPCSPTRPDVMCDGRWAAGRRGEFGYSMQLRGWVLMEDRKPIGPPPFYTFSWCPFCQSALPDLHTLAKRILMDRHWEAD